MPRYVTLLKFTEQGARAIRKSPSRAQAFAKTAAKAGIKVEAQYWTVGSYDGLLIVSADSEEKVLACLADLIALGNVRTHSLQAFTATEFDGIVGE